MLPYTIAEFAGFTTLTDVPFSDPSASVVFCQTVNLTGPVPAPAVPVPPHASRTFVNPVGSAIAGGSPVPDDALLTHMINGMSPAATPDTGYGSAAVLVEAV